MHVAIQPEQRRSLTSLVVCRSSCAAHPLACLCLAVAAQWFVAMVTTRSDVPTEPAAAAAASASVDPIR